MLSYVEVAIDTVIMTLWTDKPQEHGNLSPCDVILSSNVISYDTKSYPWEDTKVRDDVLKVYNLRLPEAYLIKLKYIAENTPDSMQQFCLGALLPAIDAKIEELIE